MNTLHRSLAEKILLHIRTSDLAEGTHVTEQGLQAILGTSRHPIRAAMSHLADSGVLRRIPNRGFFVRDPAAVGLPLRGPKDGLTDQELYLRIADDRLSQALSTRISEDDLMRRYAVRRFQLRRVLTRIASEGWIERNSGRGWSFEALIDSVDAYRESYEFRQVIEVAALIAPGFRFDAETLARLRLRQEFLRDDGWKKLDPLELFEANCEFHETLAGLSGNRFVLPTIRKLNQMRRLVEYRQASNTDQVLGRNTEHLEILNAIDRRDMPEAARLMENHLGRAKNRKATTERF